MKIRILDNREEEAGDHQQEDKKADDQSGNGSMARDETGGISGEPRAKRQKLDEALEKEDNQEDQVKKETHAEEDGQIVATFADDEKQPIFISIWVWEALLKFITRMEMALRVSLVCHTLKKLCWPRLHGDKVVPHVVERLLFDKEEDDGRAKAILRIGPNKWDCKIIPIAADCAVPDYIQGFKQIKIRHLEKEVLDFVRCIHPRLNNIHLRLCPWLSDTTFYQQLQRLFNALGGCAAISSLHIDTGSSSIIELRQNFPGFLENIFAIRQESHYKEDHNELRELILAKLGSGKPFVVHINMRTWRNDVHSELVEKIRKAFQIAEQPQSFMIEVKSIHDLTELDASHMAWGPFELENANTGEVLSTEVHPDQEFHPVVSRYKLSRCPRGEIAQWKETARNAFSKRTAIVCSFD